MPINIIIIGTGELGTALLEIFKDDQEVKILGVADIDENSPTIKLAKKLGISTSQDFHKLLNFPQVNLIINLTSDSEVKKILQQSSPPNTEIISDWQVKLFWELSKKIKDIQERTLSREKLAVIGELTGGIIHELRNPLGVIKNVVYYLKRKMLEPRVAGENKTERELQMEKYLQMMEEETELMEKIISDLLLFAQTQKVTFAPSVDVNEIVGYSLSEIKVPPNIELKKNLMSNLLSCVADPDLIKRAFVNIVNNALETMPRGGTLTISTRMSKVGNEIADQDYVEVEFTDTGCGIEEENLEKIFEPLYTTKPKGTGLGLSICKAVIKRHDGNIEVKSKWGEGTTFIVRLPVKTRR